MTAFPISWVRSQFPSLQLTVGRRAAVFLDGPGGTQVPSGVVEAVSDYYQRRNSNLGGRFATSRDTEMIVARARASLAEFLNAPDPQEIVFGLNMTTLTFGLSRALARQWQPGDEIIVTSFDHDANVAPWRLAARDRGVTVKTWEVAPGTCTLELDQLQLTERTRLIAVTLASNAAGSHVDVGTVAKMAHAVGAQVFVDAVHYAPHAPIDVRKLECDFLACSAYKFFGPHLGILWSRADLLEKIENYKVRPAAGHGSGKWETGTQNFEGIAGTSAAMDYLRELGQRSGGSPDLRSAMQLIRSYETTLTERFLEASRAIPSVEVCGLTSPDNVHRRTPTFALRIGKTHPGTIAQRLGANGVFVWAGHFYAVDLIDRLGFAESGGVLRVGFVHYNTIEEVDLVLEELAVCAD